MTTDQVHNVAIKAAESTADAIKKATSGSGGAYTSPDITSIFSTIFATMIQEEIRRESASNTSNS